MAFVIMQKNESGYVYYYQDVCYVPFYDDSDYSYHGRNNDDSLRAVELSASEIASLKEKNDWNDELDLDKCTKTKICDKMPEGRIKVKSWTLDAVIYPYAKAHGYQGSDMRQCRIIKFCNRDKTGKELYYVYCMTADNDASGKTVYGNYVYAVIVDTEHKVPLVRDGAIVEIKDPRTYHETIQKLKEQNDWQ